MAPVTLTQADNGKSVEIEPGSMVTIRLGENPTTGYRWAVDTAIPDVVTLASSDYVPAQNAGVGGGGERAFIFKATKAGIAPIHLKLWRDWEGDKSITQRFDVTVHVRD
jgi:inhibitor of cysteine peptidase